MDRKILIRLLQHRVKELEAVLISIEGSEQIHDIEIDLLLSKIRLIYDDVKLLSMNNSMEEEPAELKNREIAEPVDQGEPDPEVVPEPEKKPEPEIVPEPEEIPEPEIVPEPEEAPEELLIIDDNLENESVKAPEFIEKPKTANLQDPKEKMFSNIKMQAVDDIMIAIGLNDRFLFIRELFNNDSNLFKSTIDNLNKMDSWDSALDYLNENFSWDSDDSTLILFLSLVRRRFI